MLLAKRNQDLMPSLFNELLDWNNWNNCTLDEHYPMPKMNVTESDKDYELELCVPGLSKEDLNLSIDSDNNLVVEMVQKEEKKEEKKDRHFLRHEKGGEERPPLPAPRVQRTTVQAAAQPAREREEGRNHCQGGTRHPAHHAAQVHRAGEESPDAAHRNLLNIMLLTNPRGCPEKASLFFVCTKDTNIKKVVIE